MSSVDLQASEQALPLSCKFRQPKSSIALPPLPKNLPAPHQPQLAMLRAKGLGVGYLGPGSAGRPGLGISWTAQTLLPLYTNPNAQPLGWLACGWLIRTASSQAEPISLVARETGYENDSFIVLEKRSDGWFRLQYTPPKGQADGTAWAHTSHLNLGEFSPELVLWIDRFKLISTQLGDSGSLFFLDKKVPHALRISPGANSALVTRIGNNHGIKPLEIRGDWMRVSVSQPTSYCKPSEEWKGTLHQGWIRWRTTEQELLIFYPTRGC